MKINYVENPVEILDFEKEIETELVATESYEMGKRLDGRYFMRNNELVKIPKLIHTKLLGK